MSCFSLHIETRMRLLQLNGREDALIVFVAASRKDRAQHLVAHRAAGPLFLNLSLKKKSLFCLLTHDAFMLTSTCVCMCVCVNMHIHKNMFDTTEIQCITVGLRFLLDSVFYVIFFFHKLQRYAAICVNIGASSVLF